MDERLQIPTSFHSTKQNCFHPPHPRRIIHYHSQSHYSAPSVSHQHLKRARYIFTEVLVIQNMGFDILFMLHRLNKPPQQPPQPSHGRQSFFKPSFLEDPWRDLLFVPHADSVVTRSNPKVNEKPVFGRSFYMPSMLQDPWRQFLS
jgi:hypothetical protein